MCTQACFWPDETWKVENNRSWRGELEHTRDHRYLLCGSCSRAFVRGSKTSMGASVSEGTAAVCLCRSIPHLPTVQNTKAICLLRLSCDTFLSVSSTNWAEKKTQKASPFGSSTVPLQVFATQRYNQNPSRYKTFTQAFSGWKVTQKGFASLPERGKRTTSFCRLYLYTCNHNYRHKKTQSEKTIWEKWDT